MKCTIYTPGRGIYFKKYSLPGGEGGIFGRGKKIEGQKRKKGKGEEKRGAKKGEKGKGRRKKGRKKGKGRLKVGEKNGIL